MKITLLCLSLFLSASLFGQTSGNGVTDIDGNYYETVIIGTQEWMAENLKVTQYNDGTAIGNITNVNQWANLTFANWVFMDNNVANETPYGKLYNGYTVMDGVGNVCPTGWHVPTRNDWETLIANTGGENVSGAALKEVGLTYWNPPNTGANNSSGFSAIGSGATYGMTNPGTFNNFGNQAIFHTSTEQTLTQNTDDNFILAVNTNTTTAGFYNSHYNDGAAIRCLKDEIGASLIETFNTKKNLIKITNLLGQETEYKPYTLLIYVYDDGSTEKVFKTE